MDVPAQEETVDRIAQALKQARARAASVDHAVSNPRTCISNHPLQGRANLVDVLVRRRLLGADGPLRLVGDHHRGAHPIMSDPRPRGPELAGALLAPSYPPGGGGPSNPQNRGKIA